MDHHTLDVWPEPRDSQPRFINEPWLADQELYDYGPRKRELGQAAGFSGSIEEHYQGK